MCSFGSVFGSCVYEVFILLVCLCSVSVCTVTVLCFCVFCDAFGVFLLCVLLFIFVDDRDKKKKFFLLFSSYSSLPVSVSLRCFFLLFTFSVRMAFWGHPL